MKIDTNSCPHSKKFLTIVASGYGSLKKFEPLVTDSGLRTSAGNKKSAPVVMSWFGRFSRTDDTDASFLWGTRNTF